MTVTYPGGLLKLLGRETQPKMASHDIICLHTMVGYLTSTDSLFRQNGYTGLESHFGVGGAWGPDLLHHLDGTVYQWQDPTFTADANYEGNHRVISIETADNAPKDADNIQPWTDRQVAAIVKLVTWLCKQYDIPAVLIPDTKPGRRGIAYHRQGIDPWRVVGGEVWSTSRGKVCPGNIRIAQLQNVVIPQVQFALNPTKPQPKPQAAGMLTEKATLSDYDARWMNTQGGQFKAGDTVSAEYLLMNGGAGLYRLLYFVQQTDSLVKTLTAEVGRLQTSVDALTAVVNAQQK